ncbi:hypothetical protein ACTMU2_15105 [Cupriavidus basilensis]
MAADVYVRFGTNTTKTFGAASEPGVVLGEDDIFPIDIGPTWKEWEGDGGDTFLTGTDPLKAKCASDAWRSSTRCAGTGAIPAPRARSSTPSRSRRLNAVAGNSTWICRATGSQISPCRGVRGTHGRCGL